MNVEVIFARSLVAVQTPAGMINKLIGDVQLKQEDNLMYCDSAYLNQETNFVEAFSNVNIVQSDSTSVQSDYLRYTGDNKLAYLKGNVTLADGKNNLWTEELEYNLGTKIGVYKQEGTLQSDATTLSSNTGTYNVKTKDAIFTGNVIVTDPEYNVTSENLGYNTETKVVRFLGPSVITNDKSQLRTSSGTWDSKNEVGRFVSRSSIQNEEQYIEADELDYNRKTGFGIAKGNVIGIDTTQRSTLYCGHAEYNEITKVLIATIKPVMKRVSDNDSLYIRADTFYSAPIPDTVVSARGLKTQDRSRDINTTIPEKQNLGDEVGNDDTTTRSQVLDRARSEMINAQPAISDDDTISTARDTLTSKSEIQNLGSEILPDSLLNNSGIAPDSVIAGSEVQNPQAKASADSSRPRYFIAYHHVLVYSDSLQARCDSISYSQIDSVMRLMSSMMLSDEYPPIAWSRNSQIIGDTILLYMDSGKLKKIFVPDNAIAISQSGPEKANLFDQVQGKTLTGFFENNAIRQVIVQPNAESIYYSKDDDGAYLGANQAQSERMRIVFENEQISRIVLEQDVKHTMTPMQQVNIPVMRLSRFQWFPERRPKSIQELFLYEPGNLSTGADQNTVTEEENSQQQKQRVSPRGTK